MSYHFSMGAINKSTNNYEYPKIADKKNCYKCPSCECDVIFRNGKIKQPHFAHKRSNNPCYYYDKPNETQIHKDAKMLMKSLLDNKKNIYFHRICKHCRNGYNNTFDVFEITEKDYNINSNVAIEYKFIHNSSYKSADVAFIENDNIKYIFEICYKNKTKEENRPEPWVEINAEKLILNINSGEIIDDEGDITIECIRDYICEECIEYEENEKQKQILYLKKIRVERERIDQERLQRERAEQERLKIEKIKRDIFEMEQNEQKILQKEREEKMKLCCKCNIKIINICNCEEPNYEFVKLSNNLFCKKCNKWKCRC